MARRINKINYGASLELLEMMPESLKNHYRHLSNSGWQFWVANQDTGFCNSADKTIVIPTWATKRPSDYLTWYIAHEMAHAYDMCKHKHGPEFMEWLKKICPNDCIKYELGYKPRNVASSGITHLGVIDFLEL